jgi:hypothetical protein
MPVLASIVLDELQKNKARRSPTLAMIINRIVINFSTLTAKGLVPAMGVPSTPEGEEPFDLAIADITGQHWRMLKSQKRKSAIDLDSWREPRWSRVKPNINSASRFRAKRA